jgi:hypothetical protein
MASQGSLAGTSQGFGGSAFGRRVVFYTKVLDLRNSKRDIL